MYVDKDWWKSEIPEHDHKWFEGRMATLNKAIARRIGLERDIVSALMRLRSAGLTKDETMALAKKIGSRLP